MKHDEDWFISNVNNSTKYITGHGGLAGKSLARDYHEHMNSKLLDALHDAIRRPMGVVPESAEQFVSESHMDAAEQRRINTGELR